MRSRPTTARDYSANLIRLRRLVDRGPAPAATGTLQAQIRRRLRDAVLRALKPYTYYAHEVDAAVVTCLATYEREGRQSVRIEMLAEDLIATIESLRQRIARDEEANAPFGVQQGDLTASPYVAKTPFEQFDESMGRVTGYRSLGSVAPESPLGLLTDLVHGSAERVTDARRPYVDLVREHVPVIDVGCGRGEFLALLRSEAVLARGVDNDPTKVARCLQDGLSAELAEANTYLAGLDDRSVGSIFAAQVIEHFAPDALARFLELSLTKLKPGGVLIAEAVNPHNIHALKAFWVDHTRHHPVFPEVVLSLCAIAGFSPAYVFAPGYEDFERAKFTASVYALVASSPSP